LKNNTDLEIGDIMADISGSKKIKYRQGVIGFFSKKNPKTGNYQIIYQNGFDSFTQC